MLVSGHAVGEKGERRNNSTARSLFGITKEEEDRKKIRNGEETLIGKQPVPMHFDIILLRPIHSLFNRYNDVVLCYFFHPFF